MDPSRGDIKRAVVRLAHATGRADTRDAALNLAAVALAFASRCPEREGDEPDPEAALAAA
jgi:hypothetical protein